MQRNESVNAVQSVKSSSPENNEKKVFDNGIYKAGSAALTGAAIGAGLTVAMTPVLLLGEIQEMGNGHPYLFFSSPALNNMANLTLDVLFDICKTVFFLGITPPAMLYTYVFSNPDEYDIPHILGYAATTGAVLGLAGYGAYGFFKSRSANDESSCEPTVEQSRNQQKNN